MNGRVILRLIIDQEGLGQCAIDKDEPMGVYHDRHATRPRCYRFPHVHEQVVVLSYFCMEVEQTFFVSVVPSLAQTDDIYLAPGVVAPSWLSYMILHGRPLWCLSQAKTNNRSCGFEHREEVADRGMV